MAPSASPSASSCVDRWLHQAAAIPLLTPAEELHLARLVQRAKASDASPADRRAGQRARSRMITANLRLVVSIAKTLVYRLRSTCLQFEDLLQEGCLGLDRAVDKFDPTAGCKFSTYAFLWVRQTICYALEANAGSARLPHRLSKTIGQWPERLALSRDPVEREQLQRARRLLLPLSLDAPLAGPDSLCIKDGLADPSLPAVLERLDLEAAMASLCASGIDVAPLYRVVVEGESITRLSRQSGISKQAMSKRLQRDRRQLAVVASAHHNLVREAG